MMIKIAFVMYTWSSDYSTDNRRSFIDRFAFKIATFYLAIKAASLVSRPNASLLKRNACRAYRTHLS